MHDRVTYLAIQERESMLLFAPDAATAVAMAERAFSGARAGRVRDGGGRCHPDIDRPQSMSRLTGRDAALSRCRGASR